MFFIKTHFKKIYQHFIAAKYAKYKKNHRINIIFYTRLNDFCCNIIIISFYYNLICCIIFNQIKFFNQISNSKIFCNHWTL